MLLLKFEHDVLEEQFVEIVASELRVAVAGEDFDNAFLGLIQAREEAQCRRFTAAVAADQEDRLPCPHREIQRPDVEA